MDNHQDTIKQLQAKLDVLLLRQDQFKKEINQLQLDLYILSQKEKEKASKTQEITEQESKTTEEPITSSEQISIPKEEILTPKVTPPKEKAFQKDHGASSSIPKKKSDIEKFIGENLINKIGILIIIIGVSIGAKYAIENELISPLTRIILGYLMGIGLLVVAMQTKKKYENFSAVLLSGSMAIMYVITYFAYSFYGIFSQTISFGLMVILTLFTVLAAIKYNKQLIAHIGLVGAYAVPFLLSNDQGRVEILFSYITIINIGILIIAFQKYWKALYFVSFFMTWIIFIGWYMFQYQEEDLKIGALFLIVFFIIFYSIFLAYKLIKKEQFNFGDVCILILNSFIFYSIGYDIIQSLPTGNQYLGLFTVFNALIHFMVSVIIYKKKLADNNIFYLIAGLVLVFITIAIPVQLDGNWVTLLWAGEAAVLYWIGKTKNVSVYKILSYPLMGLAFFSLLHDWFFMYEPSEIVTILNIRFLVSILFIAAFGFILYLCSSTLKSPDLESKEFPRSILEFVVGGIVLFTLYSTFRIEIEMYYNCLFDASEIAFKDENGDYLNSNYNYDILSIKTIWVICYTLFFFSILAWVNNLKIKSRTLGIFNGVALIISLLFFLFLGLYEISELRESYLGQNSEDYYPRSLFNISIRYISFGFVILALWACYMYYKQNFLNLKLRIVFDFILHTTILWIASSELIHWLDMGGYSNLYTHWLSILWGVYALFLIGLGIKQNKKHLRIGGILVMAFTLIKLFFYDLYDLSTISKTIVMIALGVLLLIISFLYIKFKNLITDEKNS